MAMKMTTGEKLLTITLEELLTIPCVELFKQGNELNRTLSLDIQQHFADLVRPLATPYVEKLEAEYEKNPGPEVTDETIKIVNELSREHGLVVTSTWSALTATGQDKIEKAKWAHKRLAHLILRVCTGKVD